MPPGLESLVLSASAAAWGAAFLPWGVGWAAWFSLAPLLVCAGKSSQRQAFLRGWLFGAVAWAVAWYWFATPVARLLKLPWPVAALGCAGVYAYCGLMYGLLALGVSWLGQRLARRGLSRQAAAAVAAVPLMVAIEGYFPMPFPNHIANTQLFHLPAVQSADLFGMAGLCWLVAASNAALAWAWTSSVRPSRRWGPWACVALLAGANEAYGALRMRQVDAEVQNRLKQGALLRVVLLQGGLREEQRFTPNSFAQNLAIYNDLARQARAAGPADLIVWPENSYERRISFARTDSALLNPESGGQPLDAALRKDLACGPGDTLLGAVAQREASGRYYTALLLDGACRLRSSMAKRDRTPIAEAMPLQGVLPALARLAPRRSWLIEPGTHRILTTTQGAALGVYICYEAFLEASTREYTRAGAELLVNLSNSDGDSPPDERWQTLDLGAMRAIENRRFVLRPSAFSAVMDPVGRVVATLAPGQRSCLRATVARMDAAPASLRLARPLYAIGAWAALLAAILA